MQDGLTLAAGINPGHREYNLEEPDTPKSGDFVDEHRPTIQSEPAKVASGSSNLWAGAVCANAGCSHLITKHDPKTGRCKVQSCFCVSFERQ